MKTSYQITRFSCTGPREDNKYTILRKNLFCQNLFRPNRSGSFCTRSCAFSIDAFGAFKTFSRILQYIYKIIFACMINYKVPVLVNSHQLAEHYRSYHSHCFRITKTRHIFHALKSNTVRIGAKIPSDGKVCIFKIKIDVKKKRRKNKLKSHQCI